MNLNDLQQLVNGGESDRLEFKSSTGQRTAAVKTVCAMLNGLGGVLLFGVSDKGQLLGQEVSNRTQEDIAAELRRIEPPLRFQGSRPYPSMAGGRLSRLVSLAEEAHTPMMADPI